MEHCLDVLCILIGWKFEKPMLTAVPTQHSRYVCSSQDGPGNRVRISHCRLRHLRIERNPLDLRKWSLNTFLALWPVCYWHSTLALKWPIFKHLIKWNENYPTFNSCHFKASEEISKLLIFYIVIRKSKHIDFPNFEAVIFGLS